MENSVFIFLLVGLAKYLEDRSLYPYPNELRYSINHLSCHMSQEFPLTISGFIRHCQLPLIEWYPIEKPHSFDMNAPLLNGNELSDQAYEFLDHLEEIDLPRGASLEGLQIYLDNLVMRELIDYLKEIHQSDPLKTQEEYVKARLFLIEHPLTTIRDIQDQFELCRYVTPDVMMEFYTETTDHLHQTSQHVYLQCARCGPVYSVNNRPQSIKPSLCNLLCNQEVEWFEENKIGDIVVLKQGIHLRTFIPGIPELELFNWLIEISDNFRDQLKNIELYPGLDAYDIRLEFSDEVWAIDVKDYADPFQLAEKMRGIPRSTGLAYTRGFYVYPSYRSKHHHQYQQILDERSIKHRRGASILSNEVFRQTVLDHIDALGGE